MILKVFLLSSCLVLYTTSVPTPKNSENAKDIAQLKKLWDSLQMNCSNKFVPKIDLSRLDNLCETIQGTFCQIRTVLNACSGTGARVSEVQRVLDDMKGNATCQLQQNGSRIPVEKFLRSAWDYVISVDSIRCN